MICPKCRSEIGRQRSCPYCGTLFVTDYIMDPGTENAQPVSRTGRILRQISQLETKLLLNTILLAGMFFLQIITVILLVVGKA